MTSKRFIAMLLFVLILLFEMGSTSDVNAMDLICSLSPSSDITYDNILNNVYITKGGYIASTNEALLDRAIRLAISGDPQKFRDFIVDNPLVFYLKPNLWARIERRSWPGKIKIKLVDFDVSVWTVMEAIE